MDASAAIPKSAGTTAPQCCELIFNYFTVLLTGCSSKGQGRFLCCFNEMSMIYYFYTLRMGGMTNGTFGRIKQV